MIQNSFQLFPKELNATQWHRQKSTRRTKLNLHAHPLYYCNPPVQCRFLLNLNLNWKYLHSLFRCLQFFNPTALNLLLNINLNQIKQLLPGLDHPCNIMMRIRWWPVGITVGILMIQTWVMKTWMLIWSMATWRTWMWTWMTDALKKASFKATICMQHHHHHVDNNDIENAFTIPIPGLMINPSNRCSVQKVVSLFSHWLFADVFVYRYWWSISFGGRGGCTTCSSWITQGRKWANWTPATTAPSRRLYHFFLIDFLLTCLSIDIDEASPSEDKEAAQCALRGPHRAVNEQNGVWFNLLCW